MKANTIQENIQTDTKVCGQFLRIPAGRFGPESTNTDIEIVKAIEKLNNIEEKLAFFNLHKASLTLFESNNKIKLDYPDGELSVYCGCKDCRKAEGFKDNEAIFLKLRKQEVARIVEGVAKIKGYKSKLEFLFQIKGYNFDSPRGRPEDPRVFDLVPFTNTKGERYWVFAENPVLDLRPEYDESEELDEIEKITIYNKFVELAFNKKYKDGDTFSKEYKGFIFEKAKKNLEEKLADCISPSKVLQVTKDKVEAYFEYSLTSTSDQNASDELKKSDVYVYKHLHGYKPNYRLSANWFQQMCDGENISLNNDTLNIQTLYLYSHIQEVQKFYRYVIDLIKNPQSLQPVEGDKNLQLNQAPIEIIEKNSQNHQPLLDSPQDDQETEGPSLKERIESRLDQFKHLVNERDYTLLITALENYFNTKKFTIIEKVIVFAKVNKKKVGWALKEIYKTERHNKGLPKALPLEYCLFAKSHLSPFQEDDVDEDNFTSCNLYKSFTTRPE